MGLHIAMKDIIMRQIEDACTSLRADFAYTNDDDDATRRVTVYNPKTGKKLSGNAGVLKKNLARYLNTHPDWVVWNGSDGSFKQPHEKKARSKRKREAEYTTPEQPRKKPTFDTYQVDLPSSLMMWKYLLDVCAEANHVAMSPDRMDDFCCRPSLKLELKSEDDHRFQCISPYPSVFSPGQLTSPAVG